MRSIQDIKQDLLKCESELSEAGRPIMERAHKFQEELQASYEAEFEKNAYLQQAIKDVELTTQLTSVHNGGWYHQWLRVDLKEIVNLKDFDDKRALEVYLSERNINVDFVNDCITYCIGPCILNATNLSKRGWISTATIPPW